MLLVLADAELKKLWAFLYWIGSLASLLLLMKRSSNDLDCNWSASQMRSAGILLSSKFLESDDDKCDKELLLAFSLRDRIIQALARQEFEQFPALFKGLQRLQVSKRILFRTGIQLLLRDSSLWAHSPQVNAFGAALSLRQRWQSQVRTIEFVPPKGADHDNVMKGFRSSSFLDKVAAFILWLLNG